MGTLSGGPGLYARKLQPRAFDFYRFPRVPLRSTLG